MKQNVGEGKIKFTGAIFKVGNLRDASEKNIRLGDRDILLNEHRTRLKPGTKERNL